MKVDVRIAAPKQVTFDLEELKPGTLFKRKSDGAIGVRLADSYALFNEGGQEVGFAGDRDINHELPDWTVEVLPPGTTIILTQDN